MASSIRLGRLFGIEIGFNWSLVFVFALIAWTLATGLLPVEVPRQPALAYWVAGGGGAVVVYGSLLAHQLAHAVVSLRYAPHGSRDPPRHRRLPGHLHRGPLSSQDPTT